MTLAMMQIANGISALLVRGQIAYTYPDLDHHARLGHDLRHQMDDRGLPAVPAAWRIWC